MLVDTNSPILVAQLIRQCNFLCEPTSCTDLAWRSVNASSVHHPIHPVTKDHLLSHAQPPASSFCCNTHYWRWHMEKKTSAQVAPPFLSTEKRRFFGGSEGRPRASRLGRRRLSSAAHTLGSHSGQIRRAGLGFFLLPLCRSLQIPGAESSHFCSWVHSVASILQLSSFATHKVSFWVYSIFFFDVEVL